MSDATKGVNNTPNDEIQGDGKEQAAPPRNNEMKGDNEEPAVGPDDDMQGNGKAPMAQNVRIYYY